MSLEHQDYSSPPSPHPTLQEGHWGPSYVGDQGVLALSFSRP